MVMVVRSGVVHLSTDAVENCGQRVVVENSDASTARIGRRFGGDRAGRALHDVGGRGLHPGRLGICGRKGPDASERDGGRGGQAGDGTTESVAAIRVLGHVPTESAEPVSFLCGPPALDVTLHVVVHRPPTT